MEKVIKIDGKDVALRASGATYIRFRNMFHKDLFVELQNISATVSEDGTMPDGALEVLLQATYVMATQATPDLKETSFEDWLDQFSLMGSVEGIQGVYALLGADQETLESPKKKNEQQNAE